MNYIKFKNTKKNIKKEKNFFMNIFIKKYTLFFIKRYFLIIVYLIILNMTISNLLFDNARLLDSFKLENKMIEISINFLINNIILAIFIFLSTFFNNLLKNNIKNLLRLKIFNLLVSYEKGKMYKTDLVKVNAFNLFFSYFTESCLCIIHMIEYITSSLIVLFNFYRVISNNAHFVNIITLYMVSILTFIFLLFINIKIIYLYTKQNNLFININKVIYAHIINVYKSLNTILHFDHIKKEIHTIKLLTKKANKIFLQSAFFKSLARVTSILSKGFFVSFFLISAKTRIPLFSLLSLLKQFSSNIENIMKELSEISNSFVKVSDAFLDLLQNLKNDEKTLDFIFSEKQDNKFINKRKTIINKKNNINKIQTIYNKKINNLIEVNEVILKSNNDQKTNILKIPSFFINKQDKITLITGESGSGKSSFFKILSGEVFYYKGLIKIKYKENQISTYNDNILLFNSYTILLNILYSLNKKYSAIEVYNNSKIISTLEEVLNIVDIDFLNYNNKNNLLNKKHILNIKLGDFKLSSGQKQKIRLAMIIFDLLFNDKKLLMLDEPFVSIDKNSRNQILNNILNINNINIMLITHVPNNDIKYNKQYKIENKILKII